MKTALLVIDVQQFFVNKYTRGIPQKIASFIKHTNFQDIYFSKFINSKKTNWYKAGWKKMIKKEETDLAPEIQKYAKAENTFYKSSFSVFRVDSFREMLKAKNISRLVICGLDTHACVYASALEAYERGYEVKVIKDLCSASHGMRYHKFALESLTKNLGRGVLVNSKDLLERDKLHYDTI